jgi:hypothetical protein
VQSPRSLPPELAAATAQREKDSAARDPITVLSPRENLAEIENIGRHDWLTLYAYESNDFENKGYFCALVPQRQVRTAMSHDSWDLMIGQGLPGFSQSYGSGKTKTTYYRFGSSSAEPLILQVCCFIQTQAKECRRLVNYVGSPPWGRPWNGSSVMVAMSSCFR